MEQLTLVGLSDDGSRLLLVTDQGKEFSLPVDKHLRAALRGEHSRLGQLEMDMDSTLRPRDIQARIRAGESPEAVAQAAQTTVEAIMAFAGPVLAERAHIADRAQRASVRRKAGEAGARTLGDAVAAHLRPLNVPTDIVTWDAWRREDGRWTLTGEFAAPKRKGTATFIFDAPGNYVTADNEDARWLVGDPDAAKKPSARTTSRGDAAPGDEVSRARQRRLAPVETEELPLGDDVLELVNESPAETQPDTAAEPAEPTGSTGSTEPAQPESAEEPAPEAAEPAPEAEAEPAPDEAALVEADPADKAPRDEAPVEEPPAEEAPAPERPARKRKGRASVPSWDEIMFGGKPE